MHIAMIVGVSVVGVLAYAAIGGVAAHVAESWQPKVKLPKATARVGSHLEK